jgi:hypothetical protein
VTTSKGVTFVVPMAWFEEPVSRHGVTPRGDQHINDLPELVDRSVHVPPSPGDFHVGLVHEQRSPTACRQGRAASASSGVNRCTQR